MSDILDLYLQLKINSHPGENTMFQGGVEQINNTERESLRFAQTKYNDKTIKKHIINSYKFVKSHNELGKSFTVIMNHLSFFDENDIPKYFMGYKPPSSILRASTEPCVTYGPCISADGVAEGQVSVKVMIDTNCKEKDCPAWTNKGVPECLGSTITINGFLKYPYPPSFRPGPISRENPGLQILRDTPELKKNIYYALKKYGPLFISIDACSTRRGGGSSAPCSFNTYKTGVWDGEGCDTDVGDYCHAVLLVGYDQARDAWIVKNSWGEEWGDGGYIYVKSGKKLIAEFLCLMEKNEKIPKYPTVTVTDIDYRQDGKNGRTSGWYVKNQGNCGDCWLTAATGLLEAYHAKIASNPNNKVTPFSTASVWKCNKYLQYNHCALYERSGKVKGWCCTKPPDACIGGYIMDLCLPPNQTGPPGCDPACPPDQPGPPWPSPPSPPSPPSSGGKIPGWEDPEGNFMFWPFQTIILSVLCANLIIIYTINEYGINKYLILFGGLILFSILLVIESLFSKPFNWITGPYDTPDKAEEWKTSFSVFHCCHKDMDNLGDDIVNTPLLIIYGVIVLVLLIIVYRTQSIYVKLLCLYLAVFIIMQALFNRPFPQIGKYFHNNFSKDKSKKKKKKLIN